MKHSTRLIGAALIAATCAGCAPPGYEYAPGSFTPHPSDECARTETLAKVVSVLNTKIGSPDGPATPITFAAGLVTVPNGRISAPTLTCHGSLQTAEGTLGPGTVVIQFADSSMPEQSQISDVFWKSDAQQQQEALDAMAERKLAQQEAARAAAEMDEEMRKRVEADPDKVVGCGVEGPQPVYTSNAACYAIIKLMKSNPGKLRPYAGYAILQECGRISSAVCLEMVGELQVLAAAPPSSLTAPLIDRCARDLRRRLPGSEPAQYMNSCQELVKYLR